jgi:hypothetical protein
MPITRPLRPRLLALNAALREAAARHGAVLVDLGADRAASDLRLCSVDRLHRQPCPNAAGPGPTPSPRRSPALAALPPPAR